MSTGVKVGQVWKDKDKRRNTIIEIIAVDVNHNVDQMSSNVVTGLVVGTEEERSYTAERLVKRWEMIIEKAVRVKEELGVVYSSPEIQLFDKDGFPTGFVLIEAPAEKVTKTKKPRAKKLPEPIYETREQWLNAAVSLLAERIFTAKHHKLPTIRVSVGWPRRAREATIGQCFVSKVSADKSSQIFISPKLGNVTDRQGVLATLVHEMVHAIDDCENGHKARFKTIATEVGLEGKMTATHAGDELTETLKVIAEELGTYPHSTISLSDLPKVQKTYMLKVVSPYEPDYKLRMTQKMIDEYGLPKDPWGNEMEVED